jgi:hypothetical protein
MLPPLPVHCNVYVCVAVSAPVDCEPDGFLLPVQPPEAVQLVALVEFQLSVELPPLATLVGFAVKVRVGAGVVPCTLTVTSRVTEPPLPEQVSEKLEVALSAPVLSLPFVGRLPDHAPAAMQLVAPVLDQLSELLAPAPTLAGFAVRVSVGAGTGPGSGSGSSLMLSPPDWQPASTTVNASTHRFAWCPTRGLEPVTA